MLVPRFFVWGSATCRARVVENWLLYFVSDCRKLCHNLLNVLRVNY